MITNPRFIVGDPYPLNAYLSNLTEVSPLSAAEIKLIRAENHVSQSVLAKYLNMSTESVQKWERGEKQPSGAALKLLVLAKEKGLDAIA